MHRFSLSVDTRAPTGTTNAYLLGAEDPAADTLLVDPAAQSDDIDAAVAESGLDHVAVTHTHPDHVGAVAHYAGVDRDPTVWAHAGFADAFVAATGVEPDRTFTDGDRVGPATVVATPGHASDHVAFAFTDYGGGEVEHESETEDGSERDRLLVGDLAIAEGSVVVGGPEADLSEYLRSLRRVRAREPSRLHPGHGPPIEDPAATLDRLVEHRLDRERAVLAAVEQGASDVDAVVDAAYEKDLTGVADLARATTVAHLEKLVAEGQIGPEWRCSDKQ